MNPVLLLAVRAALGGSFVVVFALIGEAVQPKRFSGIFGAAPSVALANLSLVVAVEGVSKARIESQGMIAGGIAMTLACAVGIYTVRRFHALRGSAAMVLTWIAVAAAADVVVYR